MLETRLLVIAAITAACAACTVDSQAGGDDPPAVVARWTGAEAQFSWTWDREVDAFNVIVTRDGVRGSQTELSGSTRTFSAAAEGATAVSLGLQACVKGLLASACTEWTSVEARR